MRSQAQDLVAQERAEDLIEAAGYSEAIVILNEIITAESTDTRPLLLRATAHEGRRDFLSAARDYERIVRINPGSEEALDGLRRVRTAQGGVQQPGSVSTNVPSAAMTQEEVKELPDPLSVIPVTEGLASSFEGSYEIVRNAHGYYVLPYYPETYRARSVQASDMETTIARAKREGAWIATTSEVLTWWRKRDQVRPVIASRGRDEMHIDLINDSDTPISGLVLEIRGREGQYRNMRISGGEGETLYIEELDVKLVYLPKLDLGGNRITLTWRR